MLDRGAVGHNHLWFHRDAIEAFLAAGDADNALRHGTAREDYSRAEPLAWSTLFAARGRCLAAILRGQLHERSVAELERIHTELLGTGFKPFVKRVEAALKQA